VSVSSPRGLAVDVLVRVEHGGYSNLVLAAMLRRASLDGRDRAFATDLVYGTVRWQRALDHLLARVVNRPLSRLDPPVRAALRLGAYQLLQGVPDHAAVSETVAAAPGRARPLVNAALRRLGELGPPWPWPDGADTAALGVRLSFPDWIVERLMGDLGPAEAVAVLEEANRPAMLTLRPNRRRGSPERVADELRAGGADVRPGSLVPTALRVRGAGDPAGSAVIAKGWATPQDEASQAVVEAMALDGGHRVLDVAAAPGGKATGAAERVGDEGLVVAGDVHPGRLRLVERAARRLRLPNIAVVVADGHAPPVRPGSCDRVLVDAPCTGLGVLRRRPEARWRVKAHDVESLATLQRALLTSSTAAVRPGGIVVYAVCTLTREETTGVDDWLADTRPDLVPLEPPGRPWRAWGRGALLFPHDSGTDGMFVLRMQRRQSSTAR
jgi:16S rRNA (cytosine967-C5)-methyltransferase